MATKKAPAAKKAEPHKVVVTDHGEDGTTVTFDGVDIGGCEKEEVSADIGDILAKLAEKLGGNVFEVEEEEADEEEAEEEEEEPTA